MNILQQTTKELQEQTAYVLTLQQELARVTDENAKLQSQVNRLMKLLGEYDAFCQTHLDALSKATSLQMQETERDHHGE